MKLTEIHTNFKTDKGTAHNYLNFYDSIFSNLRLEKLNILEIGVLFGGSLKMWEYYFENSKIYGVEDFSQKDGHGYYFNAPVIENEVRQDLSSHDRINLFVYNCEDLEAMNSNLKNLKFDIIIDDGSHSINQQVSNIINYYQYLNDNGIYICEDVQSMYEGQMIIDEFKSKYEKYQNIEIINMVPTKASDDRIVLLKK